MYITGDSIHWSNIINNLGVEWKSKGKMSLAFQFLISNMNIQMPSVVAALFVLPF